MTARCPDITTHGPHQWRKNWMFRHSCPGVTVVGCGSAEWHSPHWHGEFGDELCHGRGLGAVCPHGVQMLNECNNCEQKKVAG